MKKRFGFTLAEVLITLGIIGVVAAMTIPSLIQNTNSVKFSSQFKKDVATLSNALEMAQAHYDITGVHELNAACQTPETDSLDIDAVAPAVYRRSICGLLNSTLSGIRYINTLQNAYAGGTVPAAATSGVTAQNGRVYAMADGSWIVVDSRAKFNANQAANTCNLLPGQDPGTIFGQGSPCRGFIDVNGRAGASMATTCNGGANSPLTTTAANQRNCVIRQNDVHDIFPIIFHNGVVSPGSAAAAVALTKSK